MTSEVRFTKGPWLAAAKPSSTVGWPIVSSSGRSICNVSYVQHTDQNPPVAGDRAFNIEARANAALIAAAPTMYEALDNLLRETELAGFSAAKDYGWPTVLPAARAALAKARGQS